MVFLLVVIAKFVVCVWDPREMIDILFIDPPYSWIVNAWKHHDTARKNLDGRISNPSEVIMV